MRTFLAYTTARILMFVVAAVVLYLCGARGILLIALALIVSALLSYILLNQQRERIAAALNGRIGKATSKVTSKATEFKERLDEGAAAEDDANEAAASAGNADAAKTVS